MRSESSYLGSVKFSWGVRNPRVLRTDLEDSPMLQGVTKTFSQQDMDSAAILKRSLNKEAMKTLLNVVHALIDD
ncbi:hypothetical protein TNCV_3957501 [Trichonephila clavipes]|nr:hypothetical protein TNCV_3957501 [Trichonephila clavipes]